MFGQVRSMRLISSSSTAPWWRSAFMKPLIVLTTAAAPPRRTSPQESIPIRCFWFFYLELSRPQLFVCKTCSNWLIKRVQPRSSSIFSKQYSAGSSLFWRPDNLTQKYHDFTLLWLQLEKIADFEMSVEKKHFSSRWTQSILLWNNVKNILYILL